MSDSLNIEFVGLPGTGKSWLCQRLHERLEQDSAVMVASGKPVDEQSWTKVQAGKLERAISFVAAHPKVASNLVKAVRRSRQRSRTDAVKKTINLFSELSRVDSADANLLLEQGVLQAIWSIAMRADSPVVSELVTEVLPWMPAVVVRVEADYSEISERMKNRVNGRSRFDDLPEDQRAEEFEVGAKLFSEILDAWQERASGTRLLTVTNSNGANTDGILSGLIQECRV